jgi:hypothetical protein
MWTAQQPIGSGYDAFTTGADMISGIDLSGTHDRSEKRAERRHPDPVRRQSPD